MTLPRRVLGSIVAVAVALGIAGLSRVPTGSSSQQAAVLRLSWRIRALREEECRPRTPEELEALAPHMRTPTVCTGRSSDYRLSVLVEGEEVVRDTIRPIGMRGERPVYVYRDVPLEPGLHEVAVRFGPLGDEEEENDDHEAEDEPLESPEEREANHVAPPAAGTLVWYGSLDVVSGEIALITLDAAGSALERRAR